MLSDYNLSLNTFVCINVSATAEPSKQILQTPLSKIMSTVEH
jgi:hypothetical protein